MHRPLDVRNSWRQSRPIRHAVIGLAVITQFGAVWGCLGKDGPPPAPGVGAIELEVVPQLVRIAQGSEFVASIRLTRLGTFTGGVQLTATRFPEGVTVEFSPSNMIPPGVTTASVTVKVAPNAALGSPANPILIAALGDGVGYSSFFELTVILPSTAGVSGNLLPATYDLFPGQSLDGSVVIIRQGGFVGPVQVRLTDPFPAGITHTLVQEAGNPDRYLFRVTAASNVQPTSGSFGVEITGTGLPRPTLVNGLYRVLPAPTVTLSLTRSQLTTRAGSSDTTTVFSVRSNGNTGVLTYSLVGAPAGVTATFTADDITQSKAAVRVAATTATVPGTYNVSIRAGGTMNGAPFEASIPVQLRVLSPTGVDYTLILSDVSLAQGTTVTSNVGIIRTGGFSGTVNLSIGVAPGQSDPGELRLSVAPAAATGNSASISAAAGVSVMPGTYRYRLYSTSATLPDTLSVPFSVVVTAARRATTITIVQLVNGVPQAPTTDPLPAGASRSFAAVVQDQNAQVLVNEPVRWTSSNTAVADVNASGVVTGLAAGSATITATPVNNPNNIRGIVTITVTATAGSAVTHIEIEPTGALITAPGIQTYRARLFNAAGSQIAKDANGTVEFISSNPSIAEVTSTGVRSGVDTAAVSGKSGGSVMVTARYLVAGQLQRSDATSLVVNAPGTANSQGSVHISTAGDVRTLQRGQSVLFQLIVRNVAGQVVTSGLTPTFDLSDASISIAPATVGQPGFFYTMTAASNAPIGSSVLLRYTVPGASGSTRIQIAP